MNVFEPDSQWTKLIEQGVLDNCSLVAYSNVGKFAMIHEIAVHWFKESRSDWSINLSGMNGRAYITMLI